jgi:hypothetical protein
MTFWTRREITIVVKNYRNCGAAWCSRATGRSVSAVYQLAGKWNLCRRRITLTDCQITKAIEKLHPQGYSDNEIAQWLARKHKKRTDRHRVGRLRRRLNLPNNAYSARRCQRVAQRTGKWLRENGLVSLCELRIKQWNDWKRSLGWPEELTVLAVKSLEAFWQLGPGVPITRLQLCQLIGYTSRKRTDPTSRAKGGTVLAELMRAGFISASCRGVPGKISGKLDHRGKPVPVTFYYLRHGVKPNGNRIEQTESTTKQVKRHAN